MANIVVQNGGKYSAELTKKCTHLVCDISYTWFSLNCMCISHLMLSLVR